MPTYYIGIDVGGTKIAAAAFDLDSQTLSGDVITPTASHDGPDAVVRQIADVARQVSLKAGLRLEDVRGLGVGLPATVDLETGQTWLLPNIPGDWWGKPVGALLRDDLGLPVALMNDARLFTLGEANYGAGRGYSCVVGVTLGTGIGGGIAIDGKLHLGLAGSAGEVGHHTIAFDGTPDGSGNPGAWEAYGSGPAIAAMGAKAVMQGINTRIGKLVDYDLNRITPRVILQAAQDGDELAQSILNHAAEYLGAGLSNIIMIVAPHCIVIGGGVAELGDLLMKPVMDAVQRRCRLMPIEKLAIKKAELGGHAGIIGAATLAHQRAR